MPQTESPGRLLPTPRASDGTKGGPAQRGSRGDLGLPAVAIQIQPTPKASAGHGAGNGSRQDGWNLATTAHDLTTEHTANHQKAWGAYASVIDRWTNILGRPALPPIQPGMRGQPVLAPAFVEWLMGLPSGWVLDIGLPRRVALRVLGNGVVPQQAATALRLLLGQCRWNEPHVIHDRLNRNFPSSPGAFGRHSGSKS